MSGDVNSKRDVNANPAAHAQGLKTLKAGKTNTVASKM